ncbi:hypothetical protein [Amycolatopsis anabasis]|uniref:hypothetical protein n=1 Tax=Amycolatopsis anabasis TaxID=1840409 RepID=UPI00131C17E0|nr:hypothetical protein [Amycolatopsis anabasis]
MSDEYLRRVSEWLRSAAPTPRPLPEVPGEPVLSPAEPEVYPELNLPWPRQSVENLRR